jgi:hypothetical protein
MLLSTLPTLENGVDSIPASMLWDLPFAFRSKGTYTRKGRRFHFRGLTLLNFRLQRSLDSIKIGLWLLAWHGFVKERLTALQADR